MALSGVTLQMIKISIMVVNQFNQNSMVRMVQRLGFIAIGLFLGFTIAKGLNFWFLFAMFVAPILIALAMIYMEENYVGFEDFINLKGIGNFGTVVLTTLVPAITITVPLIFMEWSIFVKIAIVVAFMLIAPLICWADSEGYGIFGAMGVEW